MLFDDIIKLEDFDSDLLIDILMYGISFKTLIGSEPMGIRLD